MQEVKINAGVTLMNDFCRPGSKKFQSYIDYIDREEARRNNALSTYNIFSDYERYNEYMGDPEKSTGIFTEDKDALTYAEKKELKSIFKMAQNNKSLMWQTVISFDNNWLEKNSIYDTEKKVIDEQRIKAVTRLAINRLLKSEGLEHAVWSAGIHYNTDNIHVHIATVEPYPLREKILYQGRREVRGKFKLGNLEKCRSVVVNELMQTREINLRINDIIRKDIVNFMKERELSDDPEIKQKFLELCNILQMNPFGKTYYGNREMAPYRNRIDEISKLFLDKYCPEKYRELVTILEHQSRLYEEAYGRGERRSFSYYKEDKIAELMKRMGNATLECAGRYIKGIEEKAQQYEGRSRLPEYTGYEGKADIDMERLEQDQDTAILQDENDVMENISAEIPEEDIDFRLQVSAPKRISSELQIELEEAEQYLAASELTGSNTEKMPNLSYKNYFGEFKEQRKNLKHILSEGNQEQAYAFLEALNNRSDNPFIQHLLGEMYLYGQLVEVSLEKAEECFQAALSRFEKDVYTIPEEEKGFDYQRYVLYRIGKQYDRGWGTEEDAEIAADWYSESRTGYANFALGRLYYEGRGVEQDYQKAFTYFSRSGNNGFAKLMGAKMYEKGLGVEQDIKASQSLYKDAFEAFMEAEEKEPDGLFEYQLGSMLYYGKGCEQDTEKAIFYLQEAVKQKNVPSILLLSIIEINEGVTEDMPQLIEMLKELSLNGDNMNAQYVLGWIYTTEWEFHDPGAGIKEYEKAADKGHAYAQYRLGQLYVNPELEVYDLKKGVSYLESAAEQGNEYAKYLLGKLYVNSELEIYDLEKGISYLEKAAEKGNQYAEYFLGKLYIDSELEIYDIEKGIRYLEKSMERGNEYAKYALARMYLDETSVGYTPEKGMQYILELAEEGNQWAQFRAGVEYAKGKNVEKDFVKAVDWLNKAAKQGNELAQLFLDDFMVKQSSPWYVKKGRFLGELDKAMMALRSSFYAAQQETMKNILMYEQELEEELYLSD